MIDKLKAFWQKIGDTIAYVLAPVFALAGVIWYLCTKNSRLQGQLDRERADKEMAHLLDEKERAKKEADDAEAKYRTDARDLVRAIDEFESGEPPKSSS